jgi:hypothetical protein
VTRAVLAVLLLAAACKGPPVRGGECVAGADRCSENTLQRCAEDGESWVDVEACSDQGLVCVADEGCRVCFPDTRGCEGLDIVRCRPDGTGTDVIASCGEGDDVCWGGECINACALAADTESYVGCEYWAVDLDNAVVSDFGAASAQQFSVVLSNPGVLTATARVEIFCTAEDALVLGCIAGEAFTVEGPFTVAPGDLEIVDLDPRELDGSTSPEANDGPGTFVSHHAYRISSSSPLVAYQFNPLENVGVFSNDASLLLPTEALADKYMVLSWPQTLAVTADPETNGGIHLRAFLTIVGIEDDTAVTIALDTDTIAGGGLPAHTAGETIEVTLDRYQVLNLETGSFNADFTGTAVTATERIAVFTGSEASDAPRFDTLADRQCCADHLEEQLFPEVSFGVHFAAVKTPLRSAVIADAGWDVEVVPDEPEYWRVVATAANTVITTNLPIPDDEFVLQRGESKIFESERDFVLESTEPIAFGQFPASQLATGIPSTLPGGERPPGGDPSYMVVPPVEQWRTEYLFLVPNKYAYDYLLIAAPADAELRYDQIPLDHVLLCEYEPIGTLPTGPGDTPEEYVAIRCPLSMPTPEGPGLQDDGVHFLETTNNRPFGLMVWGWDSFVSYGYPGGSNVEPINLK